MRHKRPSQAGEGGGQSGALCRGLPASFDGSIGPAQVVGDLIFSPVGRAETGGCPGGGGGFFLRMGEETSRLQPRFHLLLRFFFFKKKSISDEYKYHCCVQHT